ncbi:MAG: 4Fe-4S binding protein, partial [Candidatus Omnitrophica bacterium]|nr:4Fe-4S binding protein [Candidatus Omnitrophota bacterium]
DICPVRVFRISQNFNRMGYHYIEPEGEGKNNCTGCQRCVMICPDVAIEILKTNKQGGEDEDRSNS